MNFNTTKMQMIRGPGSTVRTGSHHLRDHSSKLLADLRSTPEMLPDIPSNLCRAHCSPMVVTLHLVVEDLPFLRCGVGDQLGLNDLQNVVADVRQFCLDLGLVILDERKLLSLPASASREAQGAPQ